MKINKLTSIFISILCLLSISITAQDITLTTQAQVDAFDTSVTRITGFLKINDDDTDPIINLNRLSNLTSIGGALYVYSTDSLTNVDGFFNLTSVGGALELNSNLALVNINGFSNITNVSGNLFIMSNYVLTNIDGFANLTNVGGSMNIQSNYVLTDLDGFSNLTSMGGASLFIKGNNFLTNMDGFSKLTDLASVRLTENAALTNVDGFSNIITLSSLDVTDNDVLSNLDGFSNITTLSNLTVSDNDVLINLDCFSNLTSIIYDLKIKNNPILANLDGFLNLTSVGGDLYIEENFALVNVNGFSSLTFVGGGAYFNLLLITNVDGLSSLTSVGSFVYFRLNGELTNLDGLSNLTSIGGYLWIKSCRNLENLDGLSNLISIGGELNIDVNQSLTSCCGIQALLSTPGAIGGMVEIYNNPSECSSKQEILNSAPCYDFFVGQVFYDINNNEIKDPFEKYIEGTKFVLEPTNKVVYTREDGLLYLPVSDGGLKLIPPMFWEVTTSFDSIDLSTIDTFQIDTILFGINATKDINDLTLNIVGGRARCNTEVLHQIVLTNTGTTILEGTLETTTINLMDFVNGSAVPSPSSNSNGQLSWDFDDLYPRESFRIDLNFLINGLDNIGDSISLNAKATVLTKNGEETTFTQPDNGDLNDLVTICHCTGSANTPYVVLKLPQSAIDGQGNFDHANHGCDIIPITDRNNDGEINRNDCLVEQANYTETTFMSSYKSEIRCSYDPNDKLADPPGESDEKWTLMGQDIIYTIRFQNTGNDTAYRVELIDTLNQFLDINTFDFITSSHPNITYSIAAIPNSDFHVLNFVFEDIYLPDSTTDQPGSNGFVQFSIRPENNLPDSTEITNNAGIYFDFNPPIITNEAEHTLVFKIPDYKSPNAICKTVHTVYVDESGSATVAANEIDNNSTDNVGIDTREVDKTSFNCQQLGNNTVELTVYDAVGNSDKCRATISVKDTIRPSIICLDTTINLSSGSTLDLTAEDLINNASDNCGVTNKTISKNIFTDVDAGSNTVVIEAVDASNNKATCTSKVEISVVSNLLESVFGITSTLSPNPSSSYVVLSLSKALPFNYDIRIIDLSGKLVGEYLNQNGLTKTIDIQSMSKGMYLLNLREEGKSEILSSFKMMVE